MRNKKIYGGILFVTLVIALFWESALIRTLFAYEVLMLPLLFLQAEYFARNLESRLHVPVRYVQKGQEFACLLYTSPSPRDLSTSRMPSSA